MKYDGVDIDGLLRVLEGEIDIVGGVVKVAFDESIVAAGVKVEEAGVVAVYGKGK